MSERDARCDARRKTPSAVDELARPIGVEGRIFKALTLESHEVTLKNRAVTGRDARRARPGCTVAARHTSWTLVGLWLLNVGFGCRIGDRHGHGALGHGGRGWMHGWGTRRRSPRGQH